MNTKSNDHEDIVDAEIISEEPITKRDRAVAFVTKHGKTIALTTGAIVSSFVFGRIYERASFMDSLFADETFDEDESEENDFEEIETTEED